MAKKQKVKLSPEEEAARRLSRSNSRVRFWAVLLALVLTLGVVGAAKQIGPKAEPVKLVNVPEPNENVPPSPPGPPPPPVEPDQQEPPPDSGGQQPSGLQVASAKEAADLINKLTAQAADGKAGFSYSKKTDYTGEGMKLDSAFIQKSVNALLGKLNPPTSIEEVVGSFLDIGEKKATFTKGVKVGKDENGDDLEEGIETFKATKLLPEDVTSFKVDDNQIILTLTDCVDPLRDNGCALARLTDDFLNKQDVSAGLAAQTDVPASLDESKTVITYTGLTVTAAVQDGKLVALRYTVQCQAKVNIKVTVFGLSGTGTAQRILTYSNFTY